MKNKLPVVVGVEIPLDEFGQFSMQLNGGASDED